MYIGSTSDLNVRWDHHRIQLRANRHHNKHLQAAWNKYTKDAFKFEIIEECTINDLIEREQYWIDILNVVTNGYNKRKIAHSNRGMMYSEETKLKMSLAQKGKTLSSEHIANLIGRKYSEEARLNMSRGATGRKLSEIAKAKVSKALTGRIVSEETRIKISFALKGRTRNLEQRRNMSEGRKNKKLQRMACSNGYTVETRKATPDEAKKLK